MSGDTSERYYCDCPVYCKHRKRVERSTWFEHAKYRNTLRSFDEHAAGLGLLMDGDLRGTTAVSEGPPVKRRCLDSPARSQSSVSSNGSTGYATMQMSDDPPPLQVADSDGFGEMLPEEDDIPDPGSVADPIPEEDTDDEDEDPDADPPASEPPTPPLDPSNTPHAPPEVIPPPNLLPAANGKLSMADAQSQRGSKRLVEDDENVTLWFIEDEKTGKPVSGARAKAMRSQARKIWTYLKGLGKLATQWGNVDSVARSYYAGEMRRFFPELRLCDLDYKADRIAVLSYPGWYSTGSSKVKLEEDTHEDLCVDDASAVVTGEKRAASAAPDNEPAAKKAATAQAKPQKKKKARSSTMAPPALPPSPSAAAAPPPPPSSTSRSPPSTTAPQSVLPMLPSAEPAPPPFTLPSEQPLQPHPPLPLPSALSFTPTASSPVAPAPSSASSAYLPPITNSPLPVALPHQAIASSSTAPAPGPVIPLTVWTFC
ncbi:hypothetical protein C8R47DRAFT_674021 [Mycena vitilis]|nr:hypothetical protein C8R47DRAFT_674021 [Mycena vitilis]